MDLVRKTSPEKPTRRQFMIKVCKASASAFIGSAPLLSCRREAASPGSTLPNSFAGGDLRRDMVLAGMGEIGKDGKLMEMMGRYKDTLLATEGINSEYLELDSDMAREVFGKKVEDRRDWREVKDVIKRVCEITGASKVVIIGGTSVVPRPEIATSEVGCEVPGGEGDPSISSESLYMDFDGDFVPDEGFCISRLPSLGADPEPIIAALQTAIELHESGGLTLENPVRVGWCEPEEAGCYPSDEYCMRQDGCSRRDRLIALLPSSGLITFTGHGNAFRFFDNDRNIVFANTDVGLLDLRRMHPVVVGYFSCNTGDILERLGGESGPLAVEFMSAGASNFIARTGTFGITCADSVMGLLGEGRMVGDALFNSIRDAAKRNCLFLASALTLVLYGDPTLHKQE